MQITIHGPARSGKTSTIRSIVSALQAAGIGAIDNDEEAVSEVPVGVIEVRSAREDDHRPEPTYSIDWDAPPEVRALLARSIMDVQAAYRATKPGSIVPPVQVEPVRQIVQRDPPAFSGPHTQSNS